MLADEDRTVLMHAIDHSPVGIALIGGPGDAGSSSRYVNPALSTLVGLPAG